MVTEGATGVDGTYLLEQRFRYTYAAPVRSLRHRLVVVPPAHHGGQRRIDHGLIVSGSPATATGGTDGFGNHVVQVRAGLVGREIEFDAWALVARSGPAGVTVLPSASVVDPRLRAPTPLTRPDGALLEAARSLAASGAGGLDLAERVCSWTHAALTYRYGTTTVRSTAAAALAGGVGVCQDYAHVMLAVSRAAGLSARYVSGHLVGEGGSHAWIEVVVADPTPAAAGRTVAVAFDPTHDRRTDRAYLTVAVGRDYTDVAPTSGSFDGPGTGVLSARKRLRLVETAPVAVATAC